MSIHRRKYYAIIKIVFIKCFNEIEKYYEVIISNNKGKILNFIYYFMSSILKCIANILKGITLYYEVILIRF